MRGNGGNAPGCGCCSRDSPADQSIKPSLFVLGRVTARPPVRQTIYAIWAI